LASKTVNAVNSFFLSDSTLIESYTVTSAKNAMSIGPITVPSGMAVTVSSGARWVVI
jgi:hypothetical protein